MVLSKPKLGSVFSMAAFSLACFFASVYVYMAFIKKAGFTFWPAFFTVFFFSVSVSLFIRQTIRYKTYSAQGKKLTEKSPFGSRVFDLGELTGLEEISIKTFKDEYRSMRLLFPYGQININRHEDGGYEAIKAFALKNKPKNVMLKVGMK